ncbi:phenylalanine--tRNA ligase subunit beta [Mycoplasma sp. Ms02]|uniref:phenylalanine--tRNA ligase subunit beta n=1 Tax=Mycoplasma sp. Ms02 TaxID=353851 RepID=UPI001C899573|nr:phenylalanine--tRNA ligase subunit beta [Mycoplasma sp. Ms02]QZE12383.1 phenylalanine--tRNA ligase subunit beta [Mycoplasma sp. Ms02]
MLLSLNHLNKYFKDFKVGPEVVNAINDLGFEVESITKFSDVEGLLFGEILSLEQNPNSDRLTVAQVKTKNGTSTIQTTDTVLEVGDIVCLFPVGARFKDIVFDAKKLKGIVSEGMFASWSELGYDNSLLSADGDHIAKFNKYGYTIEDNPHEVLGLDDYIIDVSITANRNDANSYFIQAKEIAAYYNKEVSYTFGLKGANYIPGYSVNKKIADELSFVELKAIKELPETDLEDRLLLAKHGISALNGFVVDLTNLALLNFGTPAHVYNADKLSSKLSADLYTGKLTILGNKEVEVENVLAIFSDSKPISLASVMGLEDYKTEPNDKNLLFEIGNFNPKLVRHGAKEIKLQSNSSNQASRVITPELLRHGIKFIASKIQNFGDLSEFINVPLEEKNKEIAFDEQKLALYAGLDASELSVFDVAISKLKLLGFEFRNNKVMVPAYRYDVNTFEDIIEEIFRFYSYAKFEPKKPEINNFKTNSLYDAKSYWTNSKYQEIRTFSLISKERNIFNPFNFEESVALVTYVSKEREVVRDSIIPSIQEVVEYNQKRKIDDFNFFEKGMINNNSFVIGLASSLKDFYEIKQDIINYYKTASLEFLPLKDNDYLHKNVSAKILYKGNFVGWIGKISPKFDKTNVWYAEFLESLPESNQKEVSFYKEVDFNPLKTIDLTFELNKEDSIEDHIQKIKQNYILYSVKQIDDFSKNEKRYVTVRFASTNEVIDAINDNYNK